MNHWFFLQRHLVDAYILQRAELELVFSQVLFEIFFKVHANEVCISLWIKTME
ncbi:MAG: hypothetical protein ISS36_02570 [Candidatus Aenigmarchaeota archaeon]|nr:hypothetical protein [Candidatus Aenigmarchaeota archaeon]